MKFLRLKLVNYIRIYNGLGLNEIEIDFTKCKYRTVVIKGKNGSGKSTLNKALNLFPDGSNNFIPDLPARKEIDILDGDVVYYIKFVHGISNSGKRETSKSYISKQIEEEIEELNPNGNLSSYKDILYEEFKLDSNFMSLSQLSSDDRGLADKTPAERKKFVMSIIDNLSVYNNIYKTLSKRSSIFKSMINSLTSKIDLIGDKEKVKLSLSSIENRLNKLFDNKDKLIDLRSSHKSKIELLDPDGKLQYAGNEIIKSITELKNKEDELNIEINNKLSRYNIQNITYEDLLKKYSDLKNSTIRIDVEIKNKEDNLNTLLLDRETESKEVQLKTQKLNSLVNNKNYLDIKERMDKSKQIIEGYQKIISSIGLQNVNNISREEFILGLETIKDIKELIDVFKANSEQSTLKSAMYYIENNDNSYINKLQIMESNISDLSFNRDKLSQQHQYYSTLKTVSDKLSLRPSECKIDSCGFIKDALKAFNENPDTKMNEIEIQLEDIDKSLIQANKDKSNMEEIISVINQLNVLIRTITKNSMILNKLPIKNTFKDKNNLLSRIYNGDDFKEIDELYKFIDCANIIDQIKQEKEIYNNLYSDYKVYESKSIIIDEISKDIDELNIKLNKILKSMEESNKSLLDKKKQLETYKIVLKEYDDIINLYQNKNTVLNSKQEVLAKYSTIKTNLRVIQDSLNSIQQVNNNIDIVNKQINPLIEERDKSKHSLLLLEQYNKELDEYRLKYEKVEVIRKYSSPNKGIQTLYMELYMNKTLSMANELLSLLFDGEYVIGQYIINENEFRIPCIGKGYPIDDISSMSSGQIALISMILSFVLLQQSSTKYNILKLDEMDAPLDNENRLNFITILNKLMEILDVEQCIMVSHNEEINLNNCDIIQLKTSTIDNNNDGNIIFELVS